MKWFEVMEDLGNGSNRILRFRAKETAQSFIDNNTEWCERAGYYEPKEIYSESSNFFNGDN